MARNDDPQDKAGWLRSVVDRFESPLLRYAEGLTGDMHQARDVVQETFLKLICEPREAISDQVAAWLYTVCRNSALDTHRRKSRLRVLSPHDAATEADNQQTMRASTGDSPQAAASEMRETHAQLESEIAQLPTHQQDVLRLRFYDGLRYHEISQATGLSVGHVGYLLHEAIKSLREALAVVDEDIKTPRTQEKKV